MLSVVLVLLTGATAAHDRPHRPADAPPDSVPTPVGERNEVEGGTTKDAPRNAEAEHAEPFPMPPLTEAMTDHMHNKLVHFPIAFSLVAVLFLVLARSRPELEHAAVWLIWLAALTGVATYFSGRFQEEVFHGDPKEWLVELHEKIGTASALALGAWAAMSAWKPARRFLLIWGIVLAAAVLGASFLGGIIAHGH